MGDNKVVALTENNGTNASFPFTTSVDNSFLKVKVCYLLMAQYIDTSQEYFALHSPANLLTLLSDVVNRHPTITGMIASMQILINGVTAQFSSTLKDGDEVDFIPLVTGG
jgi:molybdopterin converting factor small subunit